jgi:hypothetical protein
MARLIFSVLALASCVDAATRVAVIEVGTSGVVRRTNAVSSETSVHGVTSFWSALHGYGRRSLQHAGMTVVPDLFHKPDDGLVVAFTGVDLDTMPTVNSLMMEEAEGNNGVVGHFEIQGQHCNAVMKKLEVVDSVDVDSSATLVATAQKHIEEAGFSGIKMQVTSENASQVDSLVASMLDAVRRSASESGKKIVLHLVVEEEEGSARRRSLSRRLNEEEGENENGENSGDNNGENNNGDGSSSSSSSYQQNQNNGYYGYGYYNAYDQWVSTVQSYVFGSAGIVQYN